MKNLIGKKVKIKSALSGHSIPIGTVGKITRVQGSQYFIDNNPSWAGFNDLEFLPETKEEITIAIENLKKQIQTEEEKLKFMSTNNIEEFDETQFKVFKTLATLENKEISSVEKSKLIASLINS